MNNGTRPTAEQLRSDLLPHQHDAVEEVVRVRQRELAQIAAMESLRSEATQLRNRVFVTEQENAALHERCAKLQDERDAAIEAVVGVETTLQDAAELIVKCRKFLARRHAPVVSEYAPKPEDKIKDLPSVVTQGPATGDRAHED